MKCSDSLEIPLSGGLVALVDAVDLDKVTGARKWYAIKNPANRTHYAARTEVVAGIRTTVRMHRLILPGAPTVDHINGNGLDNRRANLRPATIAENVRNVRPRGDNTSGFKGVSWHARMGRWQARINQDGRRRHLGSFQTPEAAARAYDAVAREVFGDFAFVNFPKEGS